MERNMLTTFANAVDKVPATPALVVDLPTVQRNVQNLADYAREHRLNVRPHTKTHKSRLMSRLQIEAGACGLTVAKVGEAEVLAETANDFLLAYPGIDPARTSRIARLASEKTFRVAVDSEIGIQALADAARSAGTTIGILVDVDAGFHRTGAQSPQAALQLARFVNSLQPALRLDGIFFYPGHLWLPAGDQMSELAAVDAILAETLDLWKKDGLQAPIVSGGSTPAMLQSHLIPHQTEIRPGTYIYNDMNTARSGFCTMEEVAAAVVCTVVSTAVPGKAIVDGGTKTFTSDRNVRFPESGHGHVIEYPQAIFARMSEEHGELDISKSDRVPRIGERVTIIPNHICPCVNLHESGWLQNADSSLTLLPTDGRGRLS